MPTVPVPTGDAAINIWAKALESALIQNGASLSGSTIVAAIATLIKSSL